MSLKCHENIFILPIKYHSRFYEAPVPSTYSKQDSTFTWEKGVSNKSFGYFCID